MSFSNTVKLGAGSKLSFENPYSPGIFLLLDNAMSFGQTGEKGEFIETTPISKKTKTYTRGLKTPPDREFVFQDIPADPNYQLYLAAVKDEDNVTSIKHRIDYSNGRRAEFIVIMNGFMLDEAEGNSMLKMKVAGQQSGDTVWSEF